jgi:hypothetical protein
MSSANNRATTCSQWRSPEQSEHWQDVRAFKAEQPVPRPRLKLCSAQISSQNFPQAFIEHETNTTFRYPCSVVENRHKDYCKWTYSVSFSTCDTTANKTKSGRKHSTCIVLPRRHDNNNERCTGQSFYIAICTLFGKHKLSGSSETTNFTKESRVSLLVYYDGQISTQQKFWLYWNTTHP